LLLLSRTIGVSGHFLLLSRGGIMLKVGAPMILEDWPAYSVLFFHQEKLSKIVARNGVFA
jgi:hypothetical protein